MSATDRLVSERVFHDRQARDRAVTFERQPGRLSVAEDAYLDHETWIRPAFEQLGNVAGQRILDFGCGHGMAAVVLARRGAYVTAFDLSPGYLSEARARAAANGVAIDWVQADGERLPFADATFAGIWGNAVLHHLDMETAAQELRRVLRPGGVAVFCEPWGENPFLNWARRHLHYPAKHRTPDECPLQRSHLAILRRHFAAVEVRGYQLLGMVRRLLGPSPLANRLDRFDELLLERFRHLARYCRYVVLTLRR